MNRIVNMQMSLFGNFINIKPETQIVINLLSALKDEQFLPGSVDIANVDVTTGKMIVDSRMQLFSADKSWSIVFLANRIDVNYGYQTDSKVYCSVEELIIKAKSLLEKVFSAFMETTGNRLAVNCRVIRENLTENEQKRFLTKFSKPLEVFGDNPFSEWSVRFNSKGTAHVSSETEEVCNRIVEMAQIERFDNSEQERIHDISILVDYNTDLINTENRFKYTNLIRFADDAKAFINDVFKEIED